MTWHPSQGTPYYDTVKQPDWRSLPRPQCWKYKDPFDHDRHRKFLLGKAQAEFRNEGWELTVEEFFQLWPTQEVWSQRGRASHCLCASRIDDEKAWSKDNVELLTRKIACARRNRKRENLRKGL